MFGCVQVYFLWKKEKLLMGWMLDVYGVCVVTSDKNSEKGAMATCRRKNGVVVVLLCVCVLCI
jgi:hypothetical protein